MTDIMVLCLAVAFTINDLHNQIVAKYPDIVASSICWILCQFWPRVLFVNHPLSILGDMMSSLWFSPGR